MSTTRSRCADRQVRRRL